MGRIIAIILGVMIVTPLLCHADKTIDYSSTVVDVVDGNTIVISNRTMRDGTTFSGVARVPLDAIVAPALDQPQGEQARRFLSELLKGKRITARELLDMGRSRGAWVFLGDKCANLLMVEHGFAWVAGRHVTFLPPPEAGRLADSLAQAKAKKIGIWSNENPTPPWEWRQRQLESERANKAPEGIGTNAPNLQH